MRLPPHAARAEWFASHWGIWIACAPMAPPDTGMLDKPPALHAATASAATNGATSFKGPFTKAPSLNPWMVWEVAELFSGASPTSRTLGFWLTKPRGGSFQGKRSVTLPPGKLRLIFELCGNYEEALFGCALGDGLRFRVARLTARSRRQRTGANARLHRHGEDPARRLHRSGEPELQRPVYGLPWRDDGHERQDLDGPNDQAEAREFDDQVRDRSLGSRNVQRMSRNCEAARNPLPHGRLQLGRGIRRTSPRAVRVRSALRNETVLGYGARVRSGGPYARVADRREFRGASIYYCGAGALERRRARRCVGL